MSHTYNPAHIYCMLAQQKHIICRSQALFNIIPYHTVIWVKRYNMWRLLSLSTSKHCNTPMIYNHHKRTKPNKKKKKKFNKNRVHMCTGDLLHGKRLRWKLLKTQTPQIRSKDRISSTTIAEAIQTHCYQQKWLNMTNKQFVFISKT